MTSIAPPAGDEAFDATLTCVAAIFRFHGVSLDPAALRHRAGEGLAEAGDIVRLARREGLKARGVRADLGRLARMPLPALAGRRGGGFFVLAQTVDRSGRDPAAS